MTKDYFIPSNLFNFIFLYNVDFKSDEEDNPHAIPKKIKFEIRFESTHKNILVI